MTIALTCGNAKTKNTGDKQCYDAELYHHKIELERVRWLNTWSGLHINAAWGWIP